MQPSRDARRDWLAYLERCIRKPIAMGLERVRGGARARWTLASACPGHHGRRHQRQRLDVRDARSDPALRRLSRRALHLAASPALQRARAHRAARDADDDALAQRVRRRRGRARRHRRSPISSSARSPRCGCSRARALDVRVLEVGPGRPARRGQRRRRRRRGRSRASTSTTWITSAPRAKPSAREKAGIFRAGRPAICADPRSAGDADRRTRATIGAQLSSHRARFRLRRRAHAVALSGARAASATACRIPALRGAYQLANAATRARRARRAARAPAGARAGDSRGAARPSSCPGASRCCRGGRRSCSTSRTTRTRRARSRDTLGAMGFRPQTFAVFAMLADKDIAGVIAALRAAHRRWLVAAMPGARGARRRAAARRACRAPALPPTAMRTFDDVATRLPRSAGRGERS